MAAFATFYDVLPDPTHGIGLAGEEDGTGFTGPGFASLSLKSNQNIMQTYVPSGRGEAAENEQHRWLVTINYNPLPCEAFHNIFTFLQFKKAELEPFRIFLPQYSSQNITNKSLDVTANRGDNYIMSNGTGVTPGAILNIGAFDKTYLVTRVETSTDYFTPLGAVTAGKERLHITPALFEDITSGNSLNFTTTSMTVRLIEDIHSYKLDSNNLYQYSLELEEVLM